MSGCRMNGGMDAIVTGPEGVSRAQALSVDEIGHRLLHLELGLLRAEYPHRYFQQGLWTVGELPDEGVIALAHHARLLHHGHVLSMRGEKLPTPRETSIGTITIMKVGR